MVTVNEDRAWFRQDPQQEQEWVRQLSLVYGGLIVIGLYMVTPFLTAASLDLSAKICVVAFSVAIPLLAALVLIIFYAFLTMTELRPGNRRMPVLFRIRRRFDDLWAEVAPGAGALDRAHDVAAIDAFGRFADQTKIAGLFGFGFAGPFPGRLSMIMEKGRQAVLDELFSSSWTNFFAASERFRSLR